MNKQEKKRTSPNESPAGSVYIGCLRTFVALSAGLLRFGVIPIAQSMGGNEAAADKSFMQQFHYLGLLETNKDRFLIIKEKKLTVPRPIA